MRYLPEANLGLWDLMKWTIEDKYALRPPRETFVQTHQLHQWLERVEMYVDMVGSMFPKAFVMWRFLHYCRVTLSNVSELIHIGRLVGTFDAKSP